jgi:hypothetical protein
MATAVFLARAHPLTSFFLREEGKEGSKEVQQARAQQDGSKSGCACARGAVQQNGAMQQ